MTLKGEARTRYMREYMRRRRAGQQPGKPQRATTPGLTPGSNTAQAAPDNRDQEIARLKARITELEAELERTRRETIETTPPADARIVELEAELAREHKERNDAVERYWQIRAHLELRTEGIFTRAEFNKIRSVLHPDRAQGEAEKKRYAEAFDIFSRCEKLLKKEPLPKPPPMPTTREELMEARLAVLRKNRARGLKAAATRARRKPGRQLRDGR